MPLLLASAEIAEHHLRSDEALAAYDRALAKEPNNIVALNNSAMLLALANRGNEAMARINRAIELAGPLPPLLDTRALAHLAAGSASAAIADLQEALAQEKSAARRFHLALAEKAAGNEQAYADNIQKARDLKLVESALHPFERDKWRDVK
jgi:tetratricopeptide (TPR) repeat protein